MSKQVRFIGWWAIPFRAVNIDRFSQVMGTFSEKNRLNRTSARFLAVPVIKMIEGLVMYLVRKRFMYWQVPATTRVRLERDPSRGIYCFYPARLVKLLKTVAKRLVLGDYPPVAKTIRDRNIALS